MNTFRFVGKIKKIEDKKDKKFIETVTFKSGWMIERVKFRMICGDCSEFIDLSGGKYQDDTRNSVYTYFNKEGSESKTAIEKAQVAWKDRFNEEIINKVPKYKRYTVDLASDRIREKLVDEGKTEEVKALAGLKYTYISPYDFALKVEELLKLGQFGDDNYVVTGNVEYTYSNKDDKGVYYRSFVPTSIYKASSDDIPGCNGRIDFYYVKDDVLGDPTENGDIPLTGYTQFYDRMSKENFYAPIALRIKGDHVKKEGFLNMFNKMNKADAEVLILGANVQYYSGSEKMEITEDDLTTEQKDLIAWGLKTKEEVIREMGGSAYGERVNYIYFDDIARGYTNGPQNPEVEAARLEAKPDGKNKEEKITSSTKGVKIDLFADDDDEI